MLNKKDDFFSALERILLNYTKCGFFFDENRQSLQGYLPDNTVGTYEYVVNPNLIRVADWAQRVTSYTYDENNRVVGVTKPDGSVKTTAYDNKQRVISTVERTVAGAVITGFEYIYDDLSRIVEEKVFADSIKKCYTYDSVSSYKGKLVIRTDMDRSGFLGILFISHNEDTAWDRIDTIKHEFGHTKQLDQMGLVNYLILIGLPSWQKWGADSYYRKPWEITADIYGGVNLSSRIYDDVLTQKHIDNGNDYLDIASSNLPIWEKIKQLKIYY